MEGLLQDKRFAGSLPGVLDPRTEKEQTEFHQEQRWDSKERCIYMGGRNKSKDEVQELTQQLSTES